jgi:hypothetical protein
VYGSPDIVMKSVKASGNTTLVSKKDSIESQQVSFTGGFRISKSIGEHLLVRQDCNTHRSMKDST